MQGFFYFQQFEHRSRIVGKEKSRETTAGWLAFYPLLGLTGKRPKGVIQDGTLIYSLAGLENLRSATKQIIQAKFIKNQARLSLCEIEKP